MKLLYLIGLGATAMGLATDPGPQTASDGPVPTAPRPLFAPGVGADIIDFEGIVPGTVLSAVFGVGGSGPVLVSGLNPSFGPGVNAAVVFDSSDPSGDDFDLGTPNETCPAPGPGIGIGGEVGSPNENCTPQGNLLIIAEDLVDTSPADGIIDDPDDADLVGGGLKFDFSALGSVSLCGLTLIDVEANEPGAEVILTLNDLSTVPLPLPQTGDNGVIDVILPCGLITGVVAVEIVLNGSGAIDNLAFMEEGTVKCSPCIETILKCEDAAAGQPIAFVGRVANCGDVALFDVTVVHDNGTPAFPGDDVLVLSLPVLAPGAQMGFSGTYFPSVPAGQPSTLTATSTGSPPKDCQLGDVSHSQTATCTQEAGGGGEGCTPGFWKNHTELWDEPSDPIAAAAGFTTGTSFNEFFGLTPAESGFADTLTMLGAVNLGGGGAFKLARHGIPGLLNIAAGLDWDFPPGITDAAGLAQAIHDAYVTDIFEPLASQIAAGNEGVCPF